jgi:hypothetical protein
MIEWNQRTFEEANLFNPAFGAALITRTLTDYVDASEQPLPFPFAFLVLPIILHGETRESLPRRTVTPLLVWVQDHPDKLIGFADRCRRMKRVSAEAVMFGLAHGTLALTGDGGLVAGRNSIILERSFLAGLTEEVRNCFARAAFLGKWFSAAGSPATIMSAWGVTP